MPIQTQRRSTGIALSFTNFGAIIEPRKGGIAYKQQKEGRLTGLVTPCIGTAFKKHVIEGTTQGMPEVMGRQKYDVNSYWMTTGKRKDNGN
jgi:hypothetical protein